MAAAGAVAVTVLTWSAAFPVIGVGLEGFGPAPLAALRFAIAASAVFVWIGLARPKRPSPADAPSFLLCGLLGIALYNLFLNTGQQTVAAGAASFIVNTAPVFTALWAVWLRGERFSAWGWAGTAVSFVGVSLIASGQPGGLAMGSGSLLILLAALSASVFFALQRPLAEKYGALDAAAWTLLGGAAWLLPWLPSALASAPSAPPSALWAAVFLGIFPAAIGYVTWAHALSAFGAARSANFLYLVSPLAVFFSWALRGEAPGLATVAGGVLAICGVALVNTLGRR